MYIHQVEFSQLLSTKYIHQVHTSSQVHTSCRIQSVTIDQVLGT